MSGVRRGTSLAVDEESAPRFFKEDGKWLKTGTPSVMKITHNIFSQTHLKNYWVTCRLLYCLLRHNLWHLYYSALSSGAPLSGRIHSMPVYSKKTNHTNFLNVVPGPCNVEMIFSFYQVCSMCVNLNLMLLKGLLDKCNFSTTLGNVRKYDCTIIYHYCLNV